MLNQFRNYLVNKGYKEYSANGTASTAIDYTWRIEKIVERENITLKTLSDNINDYVNLYGRQGIKWTAGRRSHESYINALKQFKRFCVFNLLEQKATPNQPQTQQLNLI